LCDEDLGVVVWEPSSTYLVREFMEKKGGCFENSFPSYHRVDEVRVEAG